MAMFGGALIDPVLTMTLHSSRNTSLITLSVATFLFAALLAFGATDSSGKDVRAATTAYAAVLVVFVGTSTPATQSE
jgi:VIT1/CCC1 family predicted Fe2+/Mn2+ transporter